MSQEQPNNPLHGLTLKAIMEDLVARHGWPGLSDRIKIRCFQNDPSLKSTLTFLRKTGWARSKVEELYLKDQRDLLRQRKREEKKAARRVRRAKEREAKQAAETSEPLAEDAS